jgi:carboxylesterase type B
LPVIDGDFIREPASISLSAGRFIKIPLLNGANSDEGTSFFTRGVNELTPFAINTTDQFRIYLSSISKNNDTISTLEALYPDIPGIEIPAPFQGRPQATKQIGSQAKRHATITGDYFFHAPRRYTSENWAKWNLTTYSYRFNVVPNGVAPLIGATHYQEVAFVFANTGGVGYSIDPFGNDKLGVARKEVARLMSRMWISFVVTGDPNGSGGEFILSRQDAY